MSFLAPLFLLGALAVALPILFHLVRRSSKEQIPFSSLMFLRPMPPRLTKRNRLEHLLLLLLRCLVICLLALGFSRPFFWKPISASQPAIAGRKIILLMDTSASMRRAGMWAAALAKADEVLRNTSRADQVSVFTFDNEPRRVVTFGQWAAWNPGEGPAIVAKQLGGLTPGWAGTHLDQALIRAAEAFAEADQQGENRSARRIVLISDLAEGSRREALQGYDWPRGIEVQVEAVRPRAPTNAGLQWVADSDEVSNTDSAVAPRIRVSNSANAKREQFQLRWDGAARSAPVEVYVPPGQSRMVEAPKLASAPDGGRLLLTGDDDDFDNALYIVQPKSEKVVVRFLGGDSETNPAQLLFYLKRAFQEARRQSVQIKAHPATELVSASELAEGRLLIASDPLAPNQIARIAPFLSGGGTMLFVMKSAATAATIARLASLENVAAREASANDYAMLSVIDFEHPLFAPFSDSRYNDFTKIHFWKHRQIEAAQFPGARVTARFDNGDPALLEVTKGQGRLLVLTSGWQPADSQLALSSKFVPLLYALLEMAGAVHGQPMQYHVGEEIDLSNAPGFSSSRPMILGKPDGTQVQLSAGQSRFEGTDAPGIYTLASVQPPVRFAVNLDPAETRTAPLPADELERLGVPIKPRELGLAQQLAQKRRLHSAELENRQKLWRWLAVTALLLAVGETWLARWLTGKQYDQRPARIAVATGGA